MTYRQSFVKTLREVTASEESRNAQLLMKAAMVDKTMAGVYTYLPLGLRVIRKIEGIVRDEMSKVGATELLMPALHPRRIWEENGRWELLGDIMYQFKDRGGADVGLGTTHEEVVVSMARGRIKSYRDLPLALYQIQSKFRNEPRAKSGVLRGREFIMKDLYSFHASVEDLNSFYDRMKEVYLAIYARVGLTNVRLVEASGGTFTTEFSHEFQVPSSIGEDVIFYCDKCSWAQNQEIVKVEAGSKCPTGCGGTVASENGIEVGNIFRFFEKYGHEMKLSYQDAESRLQPVLLCSYGIGISRLLGAIAEICHDEKGLVWPAAVAPYTVTIVTSDDQQERALGLYRALVEKEVEVIVDDRAGLSLGEKMTDAELIGFPYRVVIGPKNAGADTLEVVTRHDGRVQQLTFDELVAQLRA